MLCVTARCQLRLTLFGTVLLPRITALWIDWTSCASRRPSSNQFRPQYICRVNTFHDGYSVPCSLLSCLSCVVFALCLLLARFSACIAASLSDFRMQPLSFSPFSFLSFHMERPDDVILWSLVATSVQGIRGQHRLVRESDAKALKSAHAASPSMLEA